MVITQLTYFPIFGKPLVMYAGIITFLLMIATALVIILTRRKVVRIHLKWHMRLAYIMIFFAIFRAILGLAPYF